MHFKIPLLFPVALAAASLAAGCSSSKDVWPLESTHHRPMSVTVVDTLNDRTLWSMDIPVDHTLRLQLIKPNRDTHANPPWTYNDQNPTSLRYTLWNTRQRGYRFDAQPGVMVERKRVPLPGVPTMVNWTIRESQTNEDRTGLTPIITPSTPETERPMGVEPDFAPRVPDVERRMPDEPDGMEGEGVEVIEMEPTPAGGGMFEPRTVPDRVSTPDPEASPVLIPVQPTPEPMPSVEVQPGDTADPMPSVEATREPTPVDAPEAEPATEDEQLNELEDILDMK